MMNREFDVVVERDADGFYVASVPALQGCHTQARTRITLMKRLREAIALALAAEKLNFASVKRARRALSEIKAGKGRRTSAGKLITKLGLDR